MTITLEDLFNEDRSIVFKIESDDHETPATISVADLKELALAINVSNERIQGLYQDLLKAEKRIENLERRLNAIPEYAE